MMDFRIFIIIKACSIRCWIYSNKDESHEAKSDDSMDAEPYQAAFDETEPDETGEH